MKMKPLLIITLFGLCATTKGQFPSTNSYVLYNEIPKADKVGDTVFTYMNPDIPDYPSKVYYILKRIKNNGQYIYKQLTKNGREKLKVTYDSLDRVQSYFYNYKSYGGNGKGFFMIHYYENGNIKDYVSLHINAFNPSEVVVYDSLDYVEKDRSKIPHKDYIAYKRCKTIYLMPEYTITKKEFRKKKRKNRKGRELNISDTRFKFIVIE